MTELNEGLELLRDIRHLLQQLVLRGEKPTPPPRPKIVDDIRAVGEGYYDFLNKALRECWISHTERDAIIAWLVSERRFVNVKFDEVGRSGIELFDLTAWFDRDVEQGSVVTTDPQQGLR